MNAQTSSSFLDAKPKMINGKIVWSGGPSIKQYFVLPESIMYYIARNPSTPEVYKKLIQSCKYFFEKQPILVVADLYGNTKICLNKDCDLPAGEYDETCCFDIDLNKLSNKIWVTNTLYLGEENITTFASLIYPKLFRWNDIQLNALGTEIMFDDFKSCASFLTEVNCWHCQIINDDGSVVMIDKILEVTPNIKKFGFTFNNGFSMINASTMKNICKLKNLQNLESFILRNIPEVVNVEDLLTFIKDRPNTKIVFVIVDGISEEYKIQLDALVDTVIESEVSKCVVEYGDQNEEKYKIMSKRYQD